MLNLKEKCRNADAEIRTLREGSQDSLEEDEARATATRQQNDDSRAAINKVNAELVEANRKLKIVVEESKNELEVQEGLLEGDRSTTIPQVQGESDSSESGGRPFNIADVDGEAEMSIVCQPMVQIDHTYDEERAAKDKSIFDIEELVSSLRSELDPQEEREYIGKVIVDQSNAESLIARLKEWNADIVGKSAEDGHVHLCLDAELNEARNDLKIANTHVVKLTGQYIDLRNQA